MISVDASGTAAAALRDLANVCCVLMNLERREGRTDGRSKKGREIETREASHCLFDAEAFEWRPPPAKSMFASTRRRERQDILGTQEFLIHLRGG